MGGGCSTCMWNYKMKNKQQYDKMTQVQEKHTMFNKCGKKGHWEWECLKTKKDLETWGNNKIN